MTVVSMTGFGHARREWHGVELEIELKSVNHRYLDLNCRLPQMYSAFESGVTGLVREALRRGHVDINVTRSRRVEPTYKLKFNNDLFKSYLKHSEKALKLAKIKSPEVRDQLALSLLQRREVLEFATELEDVSKEWAALEQGLKAALKDLSRMREKEGRALETELLELLSQLERQIRELTKRGPETVKSFQERLGARLKKLELGVDPDPIRLAQEVAVLAERIDVTEEIARLRSHTDHFRDFLKKNEGGRKLDFLIQEMGREVNTIGSKAQNSTIAVHVVEAKAILEKLREQVQNVE